MLKKKITTTMLALLCVCSMAFAAVAPVVSADVDAVQVAGGGMSSGGVYEDWA